MQKVKTVHYVDMHATIYKDGDLFYYKIDGCEEWMENLKDIEEDAVRFLKYIWSGEAIRDQAADARYARQEQIACGNN